MKKPGTPLPWILDKDLVVDKQTAQVDLYVTTTDKSNLCVFISDENPKQELLEQMKKDGEYMVEAANNYPVLVDFLAQLEATTKDGDTVRKIRAFMEANNLW